METKVQKGPKFASIGHDVYCDQYAADCPHRRPSGKCDYPGAVNSVKSRECQNPGYTAGSARSFLVEARVLK